VAYSGENSTWDRFLATTYWLKSVFLFYTLKKIASISLIGILLFNLVGYRIVFSIASDTATTYMEEKIVKEDFNPEDLVSFRFSAKKLPYYTNSKEFEIANGEVEVNGVIMTYVKKRIFHDSVEYVCLANVAKTNLRTAKDDFFKLVNDLQNTTGKTTPKPITKNIKPFSFDGLAFSISTNNIIVASQAHTFNFYYKNVFLANPFLQIPQQPPEVVA
jgi:hypothetical protein